MRSFALLAVALLLPSGSDATIVKYFTNFGDFNVRLYDERMPRSVTNFLSYVESNRYDDTIVHRSTTPASSGLNVVQGGNLRLPETGAAVVQRIEGQLTFVVDPVVTDAPIDDEPGGGVAGPSNVRGTIAMAKSGPDTVTSQWYFNISDNSVLDNPNRADGGFAAFGRVLPDGLSILDEINALPTPAGELPAIDGDQVVAQDFEYFVDDVVIIEAVRVLDVPDGDYNFDGLVNQTDYIIWRNNFGSTTNPAADGNGDGVVGPADYTIWRDAMVASGQSLAIPEPSGVVLLVMGLLAPTKLRRRA